MKTVPQHGRGIQIVLLYYDSNCTSEVVCFHFGMNQSHERHYKKTRLSSLFAENTACHMLCCLRVSSKHAQKRLTIGYCSTVLTNVDIIHNVPSVRIMLQLGILYIKETSNWIPDKCGKCWICVVAPQTYEDIL